MVATPGPVVDPDDRGRREARAALPAHDAQQGVVADRGPVGSNSEARKDGMALIPSRNQTTRRLKFIKE